MTAAIYALTLALSVAAGFLVAAVDRLAVAEADAREARRLAASLARARGGVR